MRNDANAPLLSAHHSRTKLPAKIDLKKKLKHSPSAIALGRAKQVQYAIDDAAAMFASYRSNFFDWVKNHFSRPGRPKPPRFYRRGQRTRLRFDYQDFDVIDQRLYLPRSVGFGVIALVDRAGEPLLAPGDRLVEVRVEPCRSRQWVHVDFVIRRAVVKRNPVKRAGTLFADLGVARLITCLDDQNLLAFLVCGGVAKAILQRGAKLHAQWRSEAKLGLRHGERRAGQLAARSARQMEDLMKKVALLVVTYAQVHHLVRVVVGRNVDWKQNVSMGKRQNQLFTFIPHGKLIEALRTKCARAGLEFIETEESYTSKTDHLALEAMGPKPEGYRWLGSGTCRGCFRSNVGLVLQADVNGCIGLGRKVGGEEWLADLRQRLGASPGTRLVPRKVQVNGVGPESSPDSGTRHPRLRSPRTWMSTQVALAKARLVPDLQPVARATHHPQVFPVAA